ncbi:MAG: YdeI/OmpD-associated family protein, partial [Planctomycetota bacterium]
MPRAATVDEYIGSADLWGPELVKLHGILNDTPLEETVKWGAPCYTYGGKNVVGLAAFKGYVGLWFHQGALLADDLGVLINAQDGKTKALRQWRFASPKEIKVRAIKAYLEEAMALVDQGKEIKPTRGKGVEIPAELAEAMKSAEGAEAAWAGHTPGKRREYAEHVASAKKAETRESRAAKAVPMICAGA